MSNVVTCAFVPAFVSCWQFKSHDLHIDFELIFSGENKCWSKDELYSELNSNLNVLLLIVVFLMHLHR